MAHADLWRWKDEDVVDRIGTVPYRPPRTRTSFLKIVRSLQKSCFPHWLHQSCWSIGMACERGLTIVIILEQSIGHRSIRSPFKELLATEDHSYQTVLHDLLLPDKIPRHAVINIERFIVYQKTLPRWQSVQSSTNYDASSEMGRLTWHGGTSIEIQAN